MPISYTNRRGQEEQPPRAFSFQEDLEDDAGVTVEELKAAGELKGKFFHGVDTVPHDKRFDANFNKSRRCYHYFNVFNQCRANKGETSPECAKLLRAVHTFCPASSVQKMLDQVEEGTFAGPSF